MSHSEHLGHESGLNVANSTKMRGKGRPKKKRTAAGKLENGLLEMSNKHVLTTEQSRGLPGRRNDLFFWATKQCQSDGHRHTFTTQRFMLGLYSTFTMLRLLEAVLLIVPYFPSCPANGLAIKPSVSYIIHYDFVSPCEITSTRPREHPLQNILTSSICWWVIISNCSRTHMIWCTALCSEYSVLDTQMRQGTLRGLKREGGATRD